MRNCARTKLEKLAAESAGDKAKLAAAFAPNDPLKIVADLNQAVALNTLNLDGPALLLHAAVCIMGNRDADAEIDFERFFAPPPAGAARPDRRRHKMEEGTPGPGPVAD